MNLHKYLLSALCAMFLTLSFGCDSRRVEVYVHQETGCRSDTDCDAVYGETTYSWCEVDAGNGTCHYETLSWLPACSHDWECDDGNPDSTDTCSIEGCTHVIVERQGADIVVGQEALCDEDGYNREVILTGGRQKLECYTLNVFTDDTLSLDILTANTNVTAKQSFSILHVFINGEMVSSLFDPNGGDDVIDQWIFNINREVVPGSTVCLYADMKSMSQLNEAQTYLRADLASLHVTREDGSTANVVLGANQNELRGVDHTILANDVNVISLQVPPSVPKGEVEIAAFIFWNNSLEQKPARLDGIELSIQGGPYGINGPYTARVYRGSTLIATQSVSFGWERPNANKLYFPSIDIAPGSTGELIRVTFDTTNAPSNIPYTIHTDLHSYSFRTTTALGTPQIVRNDNPCISGDNYLNGYSVTSL